MKTGSARSALWGGIFLWLVFLFVCPGLINAQQTSAAKDLEISATSIEKLLQDLEDPQKLEKLKQDLRTLLAAQNKAE